MNYTPSSLLLQIVQLYVVQFSCRLDKIGKGNYRLFKNISHCHNSLLNESI